MIPKIMRSPDPIDYLTTDVELTSVANAIRAKGNTNTPLEYPDEFITAIQSLPAPGVIQEDGQGNITLPETGDALVISQLTVTENGTYTASETAGYNPVIVDVQPPDVEEKDVSFIDYDGTILYSYTADEFAELTALPANPSHSGLTAEGWNWNLTDAKTYVAEQKLLYIGQNYVTSDGKTKIYIELEETDLSPYLGFATNGTVTIDWGDGTATQNVTGSNWIEETDVINTQHNYTNPGKYCISLTLVSGVICFWGNSSVGSKILWANSSTATVNRCYQKAIRKIQFGSGYVYHDNCTFYYCINLETITMNKNSKNNPYYQRLFNNCYSLKSITLPYRCTTSNVFSACYNLKNFSHLAYDPSAGGAGSISCDSQFGYCYTLKKIPMFKPSDSSSYTYNIGSSFAISCYSLSEIYIPEKVNGTIQSYAFYTCPSLKRIQFLPTTPPTVASSYAFSGLPTDCKIFVPVDSYHSYITGTNYPSSSAYTYIGFKTYANNATLPSPIPFYVGGGTISYTATWYATKKDAINQTNAITIGNGKEIYARLVVSAAVAP